MSRKVRKGAIPIDMSLFRRIKGNIRLHGYRRARKEDRENVRAYRKDSHGTVLMFINLEKSAVEARTETWGGLMSVCSDFGLSSYKRV